LDDHEALIEQAKAGRVEGLGRRLESRVAAGDRVQRKQRRVRTGNERFRSLAVSNHVGSFMHRPGTANAILSSNGSTADCQRFDPLRRGHAAGTWDTTGMPLCPGFVASGQCFPILRDSDRKNVLKCYRAIGK
jgi:hypothetical protein